jgi:hypothetical protein
MSDIDDETLERAEAAAKAKAKGQAKANAKLDEGVSLDDFHAYMPRHSYIFAPTREMWAGSSVNARVPPILITDARGNPVLDKETGERKYMAATSWLDRNKPVEQMTWAPGLPMLIGDRLISEGGWIERKNVTCFNLYRPPMIKLGNADAAGPWLDHVRTVYTEDADHIICWFAHRVQFPQVKINHALMLGGAPGIGKDTLIEPVKRAVGPWNCQEISPRNMFDPFNGYLKSVMLRISEARDLGEVSRYSFYDHMKTITASPPDVLRCNEKHLREHAVLNCCGVLITTNYKSDGIYLPADDRRHYVAWSTLTPADFAKGYWNNLWSWYDRGGDCHVAAYLARLDLSGFNPKAPPLKTPAFWDIVDANRSTEEAELADVLDALGQPDTTTLIILTNKATELAPKDDDGIPERSSLAAWLTDRRHRRAIPHKLEKCGYVPIRNDDATDGLWKINKKRQVIYAKDGLSLKDQLEAAYTLAGNPQGTFDDKLRRGKR